MTDETEDEEEFAEEDLLVCLECGAKFPPTEIGIEGLWSHCCQ